MLHNFPLMHQMVWQLRAEIHATWPTPTDEDARFFVSTEVNEILEAYLRNERHYARNNTKLLNPVDELADLLMMALTVMGPEYQYTHAEMFDAKTKLSTIDLVAMEEHFEPWTMPKLLKRTLLDIARMLYYDLTIDAVLCDCVLLAEYLQVDLVTILTAKLAQVKAKHGPTTT